jgi:hypothetical protein
MRGFAGENLTEIDHLEDLNVNERILKCNFEKWNGEE